MLAERALRWVRKLTLRANAAEDSQPNSSPCVRAESVAASTCASVATRSAERRTLPSAASRYRSTGATRKKWAAAMLRPKIHNAIWTYGANTLLPLDNADAVFGFLHFVISAVQGWCFLSGGFHLRRSCHKSATNYAAANPCHVRAGSAGGRRLHVNTFETAATASRFASMFTCV